MDVYEIAQEWSWNYLIVVAGHDQTNIFFLLQN